MANAVKISKHFERPKKEGAHYRLVCLTGRSKGLAYTFSANRIVMGRSESADIRVLDLKSSREHAEIVKVAKDFVLTDLGSQNGIYVNEKKVKQWTLRHGDIILIGQTAYEFEEIIIEASKKTLDLVEDVDEDDDESEEDEQRVEKKSKLTPLLIVLIIGAALLLLDEEKTSPVSKKSKSKLYDTNEITGAFLSSSSTNKNVDDKKNKEKLNIYFQKGLREYREENYFRAMSEFEHAIAWSPEDPLAQFYLRKTKEALDSAIEKLFIKASRAEDSLKFKKSATTYCSVLRLLYRYPEDERYINAKEGLKRAEGKLGMSEGDFKCEQEIGIK